MAEDATDLLTALDELLSDSKPLVRGCMVCDWLEARDDAAVWDQAFQNDRITAAALTRAMRRRGFGYKDKPVQNHRNEKHRVAA